MTDNQNAIPTPYERWQSEYPIAFGAIHKVAALHNDVVPEYHNVDWTANPYEHGLIVLGFDAVFSPILFHEAYPDVTVTYDSRGHYIEADEWASICEFVSSYPINHSVIPYAIMTAPDDIPVVVQIRQSLVIDTAFCMHGTALNGCAECNRVPLIAKKEYTLS